ncbi:DNA repair protein rad52 [Irineochytrium annulatum]|nr:DNA repair protein rad52 [Irineochytrium annulatum]
MDANPPTPAFGHRPFNDVERADISRKLSQFLGPEFVSTRAGPGGTKLHYVEGHTAINLAHEIFGFDGWSHTIKETAVDFCEPNREGSGINVGVWAVVTITLRDGTSHELNISPLTQDIGYGNMENAKCKGSALQKARKEAITDAIKRALKSFGNALGNCTYDKNYLKALKSMPGVKAPAIAREDLFIGSTFGKGARPPVPPKNITNSEKQPEEPDDDDMLVAGDFEQVDARMLASTPFNSKPKFIPPQRPGNVPAIGNNAHGTLLHITNGNMNQNGNGGPTNSSPRAGHGNMHVDNGGQRSHNGGGPSVNINPKGQQQQHQQHNQQQNLPQHNPQQQQNSNGGKPISPPAAQWPNAPPPINTSNLANSNNRPKPPSPTNGMPAGANGGRPDANGAQQQGGPRGLININVVPTGPANGGGPGQQPPGRANSGPGTAGSRPGCNVANANVHNNAPHRNQQGAPQQMSTSAGNQGRPGSVNFAGGNGGGGNGNNNNGNRGGWTPGGGGGLPPAHGSNENVSMKRSFSSILPTTNTSMADATNKNRSLSGVNVGGGVADAGGGVNLPAPGQKFVGGAQNGGTPAGGGAPAAGQGAQPANAKRPRIEDILMF